MKALPALHHVTPHRITEDLDRMLGEIRGRLRAGDRGLWFLWWRSGIDDVLEKHQAGSRINGPHCYEMYAGATQFNEMMDEEPGTFFLTDWLLAGL